MDIHKYWINRCKLFITNLFVKFSTILCFSIRMIPEDLLRQVPYIKECQLKNPSSTPWHPQAHKHLAKIIHK